MNTAQSLAQAVLSFFKRQHRGGRLGRAADFAKVLEPALLNSYLAALKAGRLRKDQLPEVVDAAVEAAKRHAMDLAKQLNEGTESLSYDRSLAEVFGPDRAALIGVNEDREARQAAVAMIADVKSEMLEWVTDKNPCEKICRKLAGKRRRPGKAFAIIKGVPIYHPQAHPGCKCKVIRVKAKG
jgi:hypothetical protein